MNRILELEKALKEKDAHIAKLEKALKAFVSRGPTTIEKGVPMTFGYVRRNRYPFGTMEVGESFVADSKAVTAAASTYGMRHHKKFRATKLPTGKYRVWREV